MLAQVFDGFSWENVWSSKHAVSVGAEIFVGDGVTFEGLLVGEEELLVGDLVPVVDGTSLDAEVSELSSL